MASTGSRKRRHKSNVKDSHSEPFSTQSSAQPNHQERKQQQKQQQQQQQQQQMQNEHNVRFKYRQPGSAAETKVTDQKGQSGLETKKIYLHQDQMNQKQSQQLQQQQQQPQQQQHQQHLQLVKEKQNGSQGKAKPYAFEQEEQIEDTKGYKEAEATIDPRRIQGKHRRNSALWVRLYEGSTHKHQGNGVARSSCPESKVQCKTQVESDTTSNADMALKQNADGKVSLHEAIRSENFLMVKNLLDECSAQAMASFYKDQLLLLTRTDPAPSDQDVKLSLVSLLAVVSRLQSEHRFQLAAADPVGSLMEYIKRPCQSREHVSMICVLLGLLLWDSNSLPWQSSSSGQATDFRSDLPTSSGRKEDAVLCECEESPVVLASAESHLVTCPTQDFLRRFIQCQGPETLINQAIKCKSGDFDLSTAVSVLLPVMAMSAYEQGQAWLTENSDSMSILSELLSTKSCVFTSADGQASSATTSSSSNILSDLNMGAGISVSHVSQAFLAFLAQMEVMDTEQNPIGFLEEEDEDDEEESRERVKREKRRKKRQRKNQTRQSVRLLSATELGKGACSGRSSDVKKSSTCSSDDEEGGSRNGVGVDSDVGKGNPIGCRVGVGVSDAVVNLRDAHQNQSADGEKDDHVHAEPKANSLTNPLYSELQSQETDGEKHSIICDSVPENAVPAHNHERDSAINNPADCKLNVSPSQSTKQGCKEYERSCQNNTLSAAVEDNPNLHMASTESISPTEINDGWVKVGNKKQSHHKNNEILQKQFPTVTNSTILSQRMAAPQECLSRQQMPQQQQMQQQQQHLRWADVARMGPLPTRENVLGNRRTLVALHFSGEVGKARGDDCIKALGACSGSIKVAKSEDAVRAPTSAKSVEAVSAVPSMMTHREADASTRENPLKIRNGSSDEVEIDEEESSNSKWQQVARQAFAVNIKASKEALEISVTSGGETDEDEDDEDTTSSCSECPSSDPRQSQFSRQRPHLPSLPVTPVGSVTSAGLPVRSATSDTVSSKRSTRNSSQKKHFPEAILSASSLASTPRKYFSAIDAHGRSSQLSTVTSPPLAGGEGDQHLSAFRFIAKGRANPGSGVRLPSLAWAGGANSCTSENARQQVKAEQLENKEYFQSPAFSNEFGCSREQDNSGSRECDEEHRHQAFADLIHIGAKHVRSSGQRGFYFNDDARNIPIGQDMPVHSMPTSSLYFCDTKKQGASFSLAGETYEPNNSTNCSQLADSSPAEHIYRNEQGLVTDNHRGVDQSYETSYDQGEDEGGERFMPSFSQMTGAVDDNPIVTSVVETVFTSSSSRPPLDLKKRDSSASESSARESLNCTKSEMHPRTEPVVIVPESSSGYAPHLPAPPSPPPGFQFKKLPPVRLEKTSICQQTAVAQATSSSLSAGNTRRDEVIKPPNQQQTLSSSALSLDLNYAPSLQSLAKTATLRATGGIPADSVCVYPTSQTSLQQLQLPPSSVSLPSLSLPASIPSVESQLPRLPVLGVLNPSSKPSLGRWDCTSTITPSFHQNQNQQQQQHVQHQLQPLLQPRYSLTSKVASSSCHTAITSASWLDKLRLADASAAAAAALTTTCCDVVPLFASNPGVSTLGATTGPVGFPQMHIFRQQVQQVATSNSQSMFFKQQKQQQQQQLLFLHQNQQQQQQHQQLLIQQQQHIQQKRLESQGLHQKQQQQQQPCPPLVSASGIFNALGGLASSGYNSNGGAANSGLVCPASSRRFQSMAPMSKHCMPLMSCLQQQPFPAAAAAAAAAASSHGARAQQSLGILQHRLSSAAAAGPDGSPPVLFPSELRDEQKSVEGFTGLDDLPTSRGYQLGFIAESLVLERLIINQIRQQFKASLSASNPATAKDATSSALRDSVFGSDLDYYASLYRVKLRDLLLPAAGETGASGRDHEDGMVSGADRALSGDAGSRRWRDALSRIMETPWTKRQQYGDIILPHNASDFNISLMEYPLLLGYTTEGSEVAVLELDKAEAYIDPCLLEVMSDPDLDRHFILKCKGASESRNTELVAFDLCDYTLAEYIQIVQLSQHQDPLSASRLAWQLLEAVKFVHQTLGIAHGNLKPSWIFVDGEGRLRLGGCGITTRSVGSQGRRRDTRLGGDMPDPGRSSCWASSEELNMDNPQPSMASDIQVAGMLLYFILTGGQHPFGGTPLEAEVNIARSATQLEHIGEEANDLVSGMLFPDPVARPAIEHCLKHPFFWSNEKKFRLILIVGSDVLTEMKTGVALTGSGSPTMMEILSVINITDVSPNWVQAINPVVMKEMRSFRVYKNSLSELTLFIYNCCLHFDKISSTAKEVLDDPCRYFLNLFPCLFMSIYRSLKASDRTDRSCFKPFF